jgi:hypothetical protein
LSLTSKCKVNSLRLVVNGNILQTDETRDTKSAAKHRLVYKLVLASPAVLQSYCKSENSEGPKINYKSKLDSVTNSWKQKYKNKGRRKITATVARREKTTY